MAERRLGLLAACLALSALIHGLTLELPGWSVPDRSRRDVQPLQATLTAPPRPALVAPQVPKPAARPRPPPRKPRAPAAAPAAPSASPPAPTEAAVPVQAEPEAPPAEGAGREPGPLPEEPVRGAAEAPPAALPSGGPTWPRQGRIVYSVFRGDKDFLVGQTEHSWEQDGLRYRMQTVVETVGLAALMRRFHYTQRSEGRVTPWGLAPEQFRVEQAGKPGEGADFVWGADGSTGEAVVRRAKGPERRGPIRAGDQDVLSIWHQLALMGEPPPHQRLTLVSNKAITTAELETLGVDVLDLPAGLMVAHHLRARALDGSLSLEVWLAEKYGYLPVRIRVRDRDGELFDQRAREVFRGEAGGTELAPQENKTDE